MKAMDDSENLGHGDLTALARHLGDGLLTVNEAGRVIYANEAASAISGYQKGDLIGQLIEDLFPAEEEGPHGIHPVELVLDGSAEETSCRSRTRDGRACDLEIVSAHYPARARAITARAVVIIRRSKPDVVGDEDPRIARMQLLGHLTMGIAHDFNNSLTSIICYTQLAQEVVERVADLGPQVEGAAAAREELGQALKYLAQADQNARGAATFVQQLLAYARQQQLIREPIDLNKTVAGAVFMSRNLLGETVRVHFEQAKNLPMIYAERTQIERILVNLFTNARDAMPEGGDIYLETEQVTLDETFAATREWAKPGSFIRLSVADTGRGMPRETLDKIFNLFFTTKAEGKGSGLGLPTVYGIVKQHNGYIDVRSEEGKGTRFDIYFPLADERQLQHATAGQAGTSLAAARAATAASLILVAEDDPTVRTLFQQIITRAGGRVVTVSSGDRALEVYRKLKEKGETVDLCILDVGLPVVDGRTVCKEIRKEDPEAAVLLTSGYGTRYTDDQSVPEEGHEFLPKPFDGIKLLEKIGSILEKKRDSGGRGTVSPPGSKSAAARVDH